MKRTEGTLEIAAAEGKMAEEAVPTSLPPEGITLASRVRENPDDQAAWEELDEIARSAEKPDSVSRLYREILSRDLPSVVVETIGRRAVAFHDEWFEDPSLTVEILRRVLALDARSEWAFERLSLLFTMAERWDDLLAAYDVALAACDDREKKKSLLDEAARIAKDFAGSTDRAISYLKQLVPLRPEDAQLAQSLERRLLLQKRHRDLVDVWMARLPVLPPGEVLSTRVRMAEAWLEKLAEPGTALSVVREILSAGGGEVQACKLLERIGTHQAAPVDTRREALALLKDRFSTSGKPEDVVRAIELSLVVADVVSERIELQSEASRLLAAAGRYEEAVEHAAEWLVLSPTRAVKDTLAQLAERANRPQRYADALVRAAAGATDGALRVEFLKEAGRVRHAELGDSDGAIELYSRVLEDSGVDDASLLEVARQLTGLLVGVDHGRSRLSVLERLFVLEPEPGEQRRVLGDAARLAEQLGDTDHALDLWRRRLERDPKDVEALDATVSILEESKRWEALVAALSQRHDAAADPVSRRADLVRVADAYRTRLDNLPLAIDAWRRIEKEFGPTPETTDALADLSAAAQRWSDVTTLLRDAARQQVEDPGRRAAHLARMGDVYRTQRDAPLRAVEAYQEALEVHPTHEGAREGLRALLDEREAGGLAVEALAKAYADAGEWQGTLALVERRVYRGRDDAFRRDVLVEAADILERRGDDKANALGYMRRAFALVREPAIEQELLRLAEEADGWAACAEGYAEAIVTETDADRLAELLLSHGGIVEKRLSDPAAALESYGRVAELRPSELIAAIALIRVAGLTGQWDVAAETLVRSASSRGLMDIGVVSIFESTAERVSGWEPATLALATVVARAQSLEPSVAHDLERQLGVWYRDRRDDADAAQAVLRRAVAHRADPDTLRMLAELERRSPGKELTETLLRLAAVTGDDLDVLNEAGNVALHAVRDADVSRPILEQVLAIASERWISSGVPKGEQTDALSRHASWALEQLVALFLEAKSPLRAVALLEKGAQLPFPAQKSRELRYRAAELSAEQAGDAGRSVELCRGILAEAPDDAAAIALLAGLYSKGGQLEELLDLRTRELALEPPVERRLLLRLDVARVVGELGGELAIRTAALRDNLGDRPGHPASVDALADILEATGQRLELFDELFRQAAEVEREGDAHHAASLWARAGRLAEASLGDVERALTAYRRSVALEPDVEVFDSLAAIHTAKNEHAAAVGWLEKRLEHTDPDSSGVALYRNAVLRLARAHRAAGEQPSARRTLSDALSGDPAAMELRQFLAELYRESEDWALLGPLLADGVDHAETNGEKIVLLRQAAQVHRRKLGALGAAIPLLEHAASLSPDDRSVRLALADALRTAGRSEEARDILETMLTEFGRRRTPERAAVHYHLARIAQAEGDLDQALTQLEAASNIERSDPKILKLLGDVARQKGEIDAAERAYRALLLIVGRHQPVPDSSDSDEEVIAASEVMFVLQQMAAEQGQTDRANDLLESAFETAASNNTEALRFERALRAAGQTDLVLRVLDTRLERISDPAAAADILVARADLLAETSRLGEALESLLDALGKIPSSVTLLSSARDLAIRAGSLDRYMARLTDLAAAAEGTDALLASDLFMRLGTMAENELSDMPRAASFYERSLGTGRRALRAYRSILRVISENDVNRIADATRKFVAAGDQDETDASPRNEALYRLAEIELGFLETTQSGAARLEQALDRAPDYDRALALLSPAVRRSPDLQPLVLVYERVARAIGDDALVLDALTLRSALPDATLDLLRDAAELARAASDDARLATLLDRLVAAARKSGTENEVVWAFVDLARIRELSKDFVAAADLLEEAAVQETGSAAFDLRLRVAEISAGPLANPRRAADVYESLRKEEPADVRAWKPLLEVYRRLRAFKELESCIALTVEAVYDPAERNHLRMERGRILLEDPARRGEAEVVLREVLDEDPDHVQASVLLAEVFERAGRHDELNELLDRQLGAAKDRKDGDAVAALSLRIGRNLETLDRPLAVALYRESLEWAPNDRALLEALLRLYGPEDDSRDRAFVLERLLSLEEGEPAARLALELAALSEADDDAAAVERALRRGYEACPASEELKSRLVTWYTATENFAGLSDVLVTDARSRDDSGEAVDKLREAAQLQWEKLGDASRAAEILAEAHALAPHDVGVVEELARAYVEASRADEALLLVSETIAAAAPSAEGRARLLALRATLRSQVRGTTLTALAESIADLDLAATLAPGIFDGALLELLEGQRGLAADLGSDDAERDATMRLAHLLPKAGDQRRGLELLVGWVKRKPNDADAVRGLGQFAVNAEKWSAAAKAYQRLVEITDGPDQIDAVVRLAEACDRAGVPMDAQAALEQVYAKAPGDEMLRVRLRRMYEAAGAYAELAAIMIGEAEQAPNDQTRFERLSEAGDLSLRVEGGERTAIDAYRRAQALRPEDHRIILKLADTLGGVGEIEEAATLLDRAIDAFGKRRSPELSELQHCMARIGRLAGDWEAVFAWLDAAVQTDRQNGSAASELAVVAMERGELDIAVKALQVITLLKGEAPMSKAEAYLRQGMIAEQKGDPKKAIFLAKRAITQEPDYKDAKAFLERVGAG